MFEQDRFIVRLQQRVARESDIVVCFLSGSFGKQREDDFSDLDVALVFAYDESRDQAWAHRFEFVQDVLPYVPAKSFDAVHVRPYFHVALYSNGTKADYRYESQASLKPNAWDREIRILKDEGDWAEAFQSQSAQMYPPPERITGAELSNLDNRFWVMFWDVYRLLLRGDTDKAFPIYLEMLHFTLPTLFRLLPPEDTARQKLIAADFRRESRATLAHMEQLLQAYLEARASVIRRTSVSFVPNGGFERSVMRLVNRKR